MPSDQSVIEIDRKLDEVMQTLRPGEALTLSEIARRAGLRKATIQNIYHRGLKNLATSVVLQHYAND